MNVNDKKYGEYIREKRKELGLNQTEVGNMLGITQSTYAKYERGELSANISLILKIAEVLKFDAAEFFRQ